MITYTLIITYFLLGASNELIIPDFGSKPDCQFQLRQSVYDLKSQGATVESAICHRVTIVSGR
jgi:hypothetical protein